MTAHHLANLEAVQPGNLTGNQNRNAHCPKSDWSGVYDQAQTCRIQWVKAKANQQRGGNRYRSTEACRPFEECPKGETDNQHLQTLVWGNREYRGADNVELPSLHRDFIDEYRSDNDPGNWPQTVEETVHYGCQSVIDRHFVKQQGDRQSDHHRP